MAATVRDVARLAGVSAMTVSRFINDRPGVSADARGRIEKAIAELDYAPSKVASSLLSARTQLIGMIVPDVSNPFFGPLVQGAEITARRAGYRLLLCNSENDLRLERDYVSDLVQHRVEGLIVAPAGEQSTDHLRRLVKTGFPVVLIDRYLEDLPTDSVRLDNVKGAEELAAHLIARGHRRIAFVTDASNVSTARDRMTGLKSALAKAGIGFDEGLVFPTSTDKLGGYRAVQQILSLPHRPTAIFTVNNMTALGAMQALRQAEVEVPRDMALACFDDIPHLAIIAPFLTVIDQPAEEMAQVAAQLLLERIGGQVPAVPRQVILPGTLIIRQSSGSAPTSKRAKTPPT